MIGTLTSRRTPVAADGPKNVRALPIWFFAFEGVMGAAYDVCHTWHGAWAVLAALGAVNIVLGLTVLRRRMRLVKAMLRNGRTRRIAFGLIGARLGLHLLLGAAGVAATTPLAHLGLAAVMAGATMALLWFDQRVTFRALGLTPA